MQIEIHSNDAGPELWISYADGASDIDSWNARALVQNFLGNDLQIVGCHSELTRNWIIRVKPTPQAQPEPPFGRPDPPAPTPHVDRELLIFAALLYILTIGALVLGFTVHSAIEQILSWSLATVFYFVAHDFTRRGFRRG